MKTTSLSTFRTVDDDCLTVVAGGASKGGSWPRPNPHPGGASKGGAGVRDPHPALSGKQTVKAYAQAAIWGAAGAVGGPVGVAVGAVAGFTSSAVGDLMS